MNINLSFSMYVCNNQPSPIVSSNMEVVQAGLTVVVVGGRARWLLDLISLSLSLFFQSSQLICTFSTFAWPTDNQTYKHTERNRQKGTSLLCCDRVAVVVVVLPAHLSSLVGPEKKDWDIAEEVRKSYGWVNGIASEFSTVQFVRVYEESALACNDY